MAWFRKLSRLPIWPGFPVVELSWHRLLDGHLNLEHASPLVAVGVPEDLAVERLAAAKSIRGPRPDLVAARLECRLYRPLIPGIGTVGYLELRWLPALPAIERHQN